MDHMHGGSMDKQKEEDEFLSLSLSLQQQHWWRVIIWEHYVA